MSNAYVTMVVLCLITLAVSACSGGSSVGPDGGDSDQDQQTGDYDFQAGDYDSIDADATDADEADSDFDIEDKVDGDLDREVEGETESEAESEAEAEAEIDEEEDPGLCTPDPCADDENRICDQASGACLCKDGFCEIGADCVADDTDKPDTACAYCDSSQNKNGWSVKAQDSVCREAAGICDIEEHCDGTSEQCPQDSYSTASCDDLDDCTHGDSCDGSGPDIASCIGTPYTCNEHGECNSDDDICTCDTGYAGDYCEACAEDYFYNDESGDCELFAPVYIAAGSTHTCALMSDKTVRCLGRNYSGAVGNGEICALYAPSTEVVGLTDVATLKTVYMHSCVILEDGRVKCWGKNIHGQLGIGNTEDQGSPVEVTLSGKAISLDMFSDNTCVVIDDGSVQCWGDNERGQLGDGSTPGVGQLSSTPVTVQNLSGKATMIAVGSYHACALIEGGTLNCWGENRLGQLGDGTTSNTTSAIPVPGLTGVKAVSAGHVHTCVIMENNSVRCWGYNAHGQLGIGSYEDSHVPAPENDNLRNVTFVDLTFLTTCVVYDDASMSCFGDNSLGIFATNDATSSNIPAAATMIDSISSLSMGMSHSCAITTSGRIECWGNNGFESMGQVETGSDNIIYEPVELEF